MPNKRRFNVPEWYIHKFPEYKGQGLSEFLKKMDRLRGGLQTTLDGRKIIVPWRGYDKTPEKEKAIIWSMIYRRLKFKGKHYEKITSESWTRRGKVYRVLVARDKGKFKAWVPIGVEERKLPRSITNPVSDEEFLKMTDKEKEKYLHGD